MRYRVKIHHRLRETIVADVEAEGAEVVETMAVPLYAEVCGLKGWRIDWGAGAEHERTEILGDAGAYDTPPDVLLRITGERLTGREVEFVEEIFVAPKMSERELTVKIERALDTVSHCCVDSTEDRQKIVEALLKALQ